MTLRARDAGGRWRWLEATASSLLDTAVGGVLWNLRDIDDRVRAEAALRASESRYRAIADTAEEGLWVCDPAGRTAYANNRLLEILGLDGESVSERSVLDLLPLAHGSRPDALAAADGRSERYEVAYLHPDGRRRTLRVSLAPLDDAGGTVEGSLAMVSDVTDARLLEDQLRRAALHDALTGLPNRGLLFDRLQHALRRETTATAVLLVDLDRFAHVNDGWGHTVGDELLVRVAARLQAAVRPSDTVARIAGDEFLLVCEDLDEEAAYRLAGDLLAVLEEPHEIAGRTVRLTASIGVATSPTSSAEELLRHAESAMHAAKATGRRRVRAFDAGLAGSDQHTLGSDLRRALESDELRLHHQPVVDLATGRVVGTEALARWRHPIHGEVPPDRFVAVAEQLGLAPELDRWALGRALADARALRDGGALPADARVAVNVSAYTLGDPGLDRWIAAAVDAAGFGPGDVLLEVTESAIMADAPTAIGVLSRLRERGFGIAVDDFGTGHSSLAYLHHLPVTVLKIDRSFVADVASDVNALAIAGSIVELARAVGLTVVAEGVETPEQADVLRTLGCDAAQGWLWSRAVSPEEARRTGALTASYDVAPGALA
jgi:diguanylate cyclase (GGDEF)-like protein/PAS domain S-box-containing protein